MVSPLTNHLGIGSFDDGKENLPGMLASHPYSIVNNPPVLHNHKALLDAGFSPSLADLGFVKSPIVGVTVNRNPNEVTIKIISNPSRGLIVQIDQNGEKSEISGDREEDLNRREQELSRTEEMLNKRAKHLDSVRDFVLKQANGTDTPNITRKKKCFRGCFVFAATILVISVVCVAREFFSS